MSEVTAPEVITAATIAGWTATEMRKAMQDPTKAAEIERILSGVAAAEEVAAAEAQAAVDKADAAATGAVKAAADLAAEIAAAETQRLAEEKAIADAKIIADAKAIEDAKPKKFIKKFQATDEDGNPLGSPTYLEAASQAELDEKWENSYNHAVRAYHRLRKQKTTFKSAEEPVAKPLTDEQLLAATEDLDSKDPQKRLQAVRKIASAESEAEKAKAREAEQAAIGARESYLFMTRHRDDFNPCEANGKIIGEYLKANDLSWTADNLELAFIATESQLAPVVATAPAVQTPVTPATPAANPAVTPVATPVAATPVVPATPEAPAVAAIPLTPTPRPGVNGGFVPGSTFSGQPVVVAPGLTKATIGAWSAQEMRKHMANPVTRAEIDRVLSGK